MANFYTPSDKPEDWQQLLAKPDVHWKSGYSAKSLAYSWTEARGFPPEVQSALDRSHESPLEDLTFLLGFPEYDVDLPGGRRPSQNDIFVFARGADGLVSIAVEGKVSESFDRPVDKRFKEPTPGEAQRLEYLLDLLQLDRKSVGAIGYQLIHRTASAILEARKFGSRHAVMLVHSFSQTLEHFSDYKNFCALFGAEVESNMIYRAKAFDDCTLYLGWVVGDPEFLTR